MTKNGVIYFGISSFVSEIFEFLLKKLMMSRTVHMTSINKSQNCEYLRKYWMGVVQTWQWQSTSSKS